MARIPTNSFSSRLSTSIGPRPTKSLGQAGLEADSFKALGEGAIQLGLGINELNRKREIARAKEATFTEQVDFEKRFANEKRDNQSFFEGSNFEGYAQGNQEFIAESRKQAIKEAPNALAADSINKFYDTKAAHSEIKDTSFENIKSSQFNLTQNAKNRTEASEFLFEAPSLESASELYTRHNLSIATGFDYTPDQKVKEIEKNNLYAKSVLSGMLNSKGADLTEGINFLKGNTKYRNLFESLSPQERAKFMNRFETAQKVEFGKVYADLRNNNKNLMAEIEAGGLTPSREQRLSAQINTLKKLEGNEFVNQSQLSNDLASLEIAKSVGEQREDFKHKDLNEMQGDIQKIMAEGKAAKGFVASKTVIAKLKHANDYYQQAISDPGLLTARENPNLQQGTQEFFDAQEQRGFPNPKYYSNKQESIIKDRFKVVPNKNQELTEFMSSGDVKAKVKWLNQAARDDKDMAGLAMAAATDSALTRHILLDVDKREVNESFKNLDFIEKDADINNSLLDEAEDFAEAFSGENTGHYLNEMMSAMRTRYKQLRMAGKSKSDAAEQSKKDLVDSNYTFLEIGDKKIPLQGRFRSDVNASKIESFNKSYEDIFNNKDVELAEELGIDVTANSEKMKTTKQLMERLADGDAKFELNRDGDGFNISYENPADNSKQLIHEFSQNAMGKRIHKPLNIKFEDIVSSDSPYNKASIRDIEKSAILRQAVEDIAKPAEEFILRSKGIK